MIAFVAVLVFGPDKLPELARQAAHLTRRAKRITDGARDELRSQLGPEYADLELHDLDLRAVIRQHVTAALEDDEPDAEPESLEPGRPSDARVPSARSARSAGPTYDDAT